MKRKPKMHPLQKAFEGSDSFKPMVYSNPAIYLKPCLAFKVNTKVDWIIGFFFSIIIESVTDENKKDLARAVSAPHSDPTGTIWYFPHVHYTEVKP